MVRIIANKLRADERANLEARGMIVQDTLSGHYVIELNTDLFHVMVAIDQHVKVNELLPQRDGSDIDPIGREDRIKLYGDSKRD